MNNVKKNRTGLRLLGSVRGGNYRRFTMNKTQQNQPVYSNVQPRFPGKKGQRAGKDCSGSNTNVGCKTCYGCTYTFDVSSNAFNGAYPSYGSFASVNLIVDNSNNPPCEWQYNAIVEGFDVGGGATALLDASVTINIEDNKCVGDISGVYFYAPVGGANGTYVGYYTECNGVNRIPRESTFPIGPTTPNKFVTTAKRMGAPYRNPIAGWRRTLDCCEKPCITLLTRIDVTTINNITRGVSRYSQTQPDGTVCTGTIINYEYLSQTPTNVTSITVEQDNCCCIPAINRTGTITTGNTTEGNFVPLSSQVIARETSGAAQQPTNTVYKDNYSGKKNNLGGCCATDCSDTIVHRSGIQGRTHRPIIRSGMQPKSSCCKPNGTQCFNNYSYSYRQYHNNNRCLSFERSQEKYVGRYACFGADGKCQNKFRKSGCAACCTCCVKVQNMKFSSSLSLGPLPITITQTINGEQVIGTVTEIIGTASINGEIWYKVEVTDDKSNLCLGFQKGPAKTFKSPSKPPSNPNVTIQGVATSMTTTSPGDCSNKGNLVTIYKPNNKKFSKQGAVSSGSRLDRLKLDTIRASNSKCNKGKYRCKIIKSKFIDGGFYKVPNGKYDAGKPRFTGWMFNGHHSEVKGRVYNMVRYNQQPLGIPQLTAHRLTLSQGGNGCGPKQCFPRTLDLGSNRSTAAGNRARIPGSKCPDGSVDPCNKCGNNSIAPCNNIPNQTGQGLPCC